MVSRAHVIVASGEARSGHFGVPGPLRSGTPSGPARACHWIPLALGLLAGLGCLTGSPLKAAPPAPKGPSREALLSPFQLVNKAREALTLGDLDRAEAFARRAQKRDATFWRRGDSPDKILKEVAQARQDPQVLLRASRLALGRDDLDRAQVYAQEAQKRASAWTFGIFGDSPSKALRDIQTARAKRGPLPVPARPAVVTKPRPPVPGATKPAPKETDRPDAVAQKDRGFLSRWLPGRSEDAEPRSPVPVAKPAPKETARPDAVAQKGSKVWGSWGSWQPKRAPAAPPKPEPARPSAGTRRPTDTGKDKVARTEPGSVPTISAGPPMGPAPKPAPVAAARMPKPKVTPPVRPAAGMELPKTSKPPRAVRQPARPKPTAREQAIALVRLGRRQLADGKLDESLATAQKARSISGVRWGLFEDTPDKLSRDIEEAREARNKEESVKVLARARYLFKQGQFDDAEREAHKAARLHGPYSWWDLGDRPQNLIKQIRTARAERRPTRLPPPPGGTDRVAREDPPAVTKPEARPDTKPTPKPDAPMPRIVQEPPAGPPARIVKGPADAGKPFPRSGESIAKGGPPKPPVKPAGGALPAPVPPPAPPAPRVDPLAEAKGKARQLVAEARKLMKENKLVEARAKAVEAQKLRVPFTPGEDSPSLVYQQLAVEARRTVGQLVHRARDHMTIGTGDPVKRYGQAEQELLKARALAAHFGQDTFTVDDKLAQVHRLKGQALRPPGAVASARPAEKPAGKPVASVPVLPPVPGMTGSPSAPPVAKAPTPAPVIPAVRTAPARDTKPVAATGGTDQGQRLLTQARMELGKGETGTARRLALEASKKTYGVYPLAVALLRTIDAEESRQKAWRANKTFDAAWAAFVRKDYVNARNLLSTVHPDMLDAGRKAKLREITNTVAMQPRPAPEGKDPKGDTRLVGHERIAKADGVGRARATDEGKGGTAPSDALLNAAQARRNILFQKLHRDGLEAQRQAASKFRTGQTDEALDLLQDYLSRLGAEPLAPEQVALLKRPVESRLKRYRLLKAQSDLRNQHTVAARTQKDLIRRKHLAEQQKEENVARLMAQFNELYKTGKYEKARALALQAQELDPDNPLITTAASLARRQSRVTEYEKIKAGREEVVLVGLNTAEDQGPASAIRDNIAFDEEHWKGRVQGRAPLSAISGFRKMEKEKEIESRLSRPVSLNFTDTPLRTVVKDLHALTGINFHIDSPALREEGISMDQPVTLNLDQISLKSALNLMLHTAQLTYVLKHGVILITTESHAQGQLALIAFPVADLVIPIHDFADIRNPSVRAFTGVPSTGHAGPYTNAGPTPLGGAYGLPGGAPTGSPTGSMLDAASPFASAGGGGVTVAKQNSKNTMEETLIKLITSTVAPRTWASMGGAGTIDYYPHTMSLVINQTADIQEQVQDLLAALRRLQDQEVAVEVRFITINENFFERIGVKFSANILTDDITERFEPQITSGAFKPAGFINQFSPDRFLGGITPAGTFTGTLDIPINVQTFEQALPPFGGYNGVPGFGGLAMGLAFLSDIQVFLFMEAVQGDTRSNVMQAPKLTLFNGQTATLQATDQQIFVTGVQAFPSQGQIIFTPQQQLFPVGVTLTIQAVISADRRFVRMSLTPSLTNLATPFVQLFPVVTPIFPLIDGTSTGQPIVFTQYFQQPVFTSLSVQTTVAVPDGGTVLLGGLKRLSEGRNEYGPPILSKLPYVNRLFKNVGYGRETSSLLMMVTPRIIIQEEEEERQTGVTRPPSVAF